MSDVADQPNRASSSQSRGSLRILSPGWSNRLIARPGFQAWVARVPLLRRIARAEGQELFDLVSGFVRAQVLMALVELDIPAQLLDRPRSVQDLALVADIPADRMQILLQAGAALGLLKARRDGQFGLARKGAALLGVPGLAAMIRHHGVFYRDLADPVALLRGETDTELAKFWPYVFGAHGDVPAETTRIYSDLMADSQGLVAQDTLRQVRFANVRHLLDVGGGSGAFVSAVCQAHPALKATVFDLPAVMPQAANRLAATGLSGRVDLAGGSFRDDSLPAGADMISLVRVLYDHSDETVAALLAKVFSALPPGGRLIISEPMAGGARPESSGDVYFAFYTLAMRTGRARSAARIAQMCQAAGFAAVRCPRPARPYVTSVVEATRPNDIERRQGV
ncbi:methyltransferase [Meridianimarinicoccus aquatilis]|uniref:Methyltransferase domain-containing protein n=1 Tax=Meridianimarinicoccus aquatilis TaxID=2552766 RepID=A0A4R6AZH0_9RHOB|nr:methyltransferase [Fluviibacterium aquatile]TDL89184.1 methyltransferase domain-containing protein [Fluviibacterium aquatile]